MTATFRYVIHEHVHDYMACGWHIAAVLNCWACLLVWPCECRCVEPLA